MPPRVRGRGKGPMRGGSSSHAGPSHRRTPSESFSSDSNDDWRRSLEPARRSVSLSTSPSYHHSLGPQQPQEPQHSHHSLQPSQSHHSSHHSHYLSPYSPRQFNPNDYINSPAGHNLLGPEDHFSEDIYMDDDPDPSEPPSGTPTHPIDISSGSSFTGSPYHGPDEFAEWWGQWKFVNTPSSHNTPPQPPYEEPHVQAMTPSPPPLPEQEQPPPPPEPPRRRRNARMSVRGGTRFTATQGSSNYPPILEDPQMGEPSNPAPEIDITPDTFAPQPPPMGYDNPIPTYPPTTEYNPFEPQAPAEFNYQPLLSTHTSK